MVSGKKVYTGVDWFKLFAAIAVVGIHSNLVFLKTIGRLSVPFFIIISSFLFFKKQFKLNSLDDKKLHFLRFEKRISLLLVLWDLVYSPLAIRNFSSEVIQSKGSKCIALIHYLFHYLLAPAVDNANGWPPSWYLIAMMIGMFVIVLFLRYKFPIVIIGIVTVGIEIYYILSTEFNKWTKLSDIGVYGFLRVLIYIFIGYLISLKFEELMSISLKIYGILLFSMLVLFIVEYLIIEHFGGSPYSQEVITTVPTSTVVALFSLKWQPKFDRPGIRKFSTFLYCFQWYPLVILGRLFNLNSVSLKEQVILFLGIILSAEITYLFYEYVCQKMNWKFLNYIV